MEQATAAALWGAVVFSGFYHGVNPGMGWPLAVSSALMERRAQALAVALGMLSLGHFLAMTAILLPFTAMTVLVEHERAIRIGAGALVVAVGLYLLINTRHPRILARIHPAKLGLWSFLAAMAHGAGLMLVPIYLGLCDFDALDAGHQAAGRLMAVNAGTALSVAVLHTLAMTLAGGALAVGIYYWVGLKFLTRGWFNLDRVWAASLVVVGGIGIWTAL
jgi:hypothetical protein